MCDDLRGECERHGAVAALKVPRPANPAEAAALIHTGPYGKVGCTQTVGGMAAACYGPAEPPPPRTRCARQRSDRATHPCLPTHPPRHAQAYVEFVDDNGAVAAKEAIHGRTFAGNLVQAVFITPPSFAALT